MNRLLTNQVLQILGFAVGLMVIQMVNFLSGMWFNRFGVIPRSFTGLRGIFFSPLLHVNWAHLFANATPLAAMLGLLAFTRGQLLWPIVGALWIGSGLGVWLIGRPGSVQVGASGLIYALAAFLIATAWYQRDLKSAAAAFLVIFLYGGIVWGLLPNRQGVSWEGHLAGAVAGLLVAMSYVARR